ncbi:MAG: ABC transporter ATP-binding protein [Candidatus Hodarchaeales archaeon]|jgi:ABC-type Fe3+/spermidine/putrescine transport system ATPase subunit
MVTVELKGIGKSFGEEIVLKNVNLAIKNNTFTTILGASGSGKTTLLKIIAGLIEQDSGHIYFDGKIIDHLPPGSRKTGYVPQSQVLFPHMKVFDNVAFGLRARKETRESTKNKTISILTRMGLDNMTQKYPHQLSGGQMQRVALARSLVTEPDILLLDEPLSSLDSFLRKRLGFLVKDIQQETGIPAIMVTHSWEEALLSDRIVILENGKVVQEGSPEMIVNRPASEGVVQMTGLSNVIMFEDQILADSSNEGKAQKFAVLDSSNYKVLSPFDKNLENYSSEGSKDWLYFPAKVAGINEDFTGLSDYKAIVRLESLDQYIVIRLDKRDLGVENVKRQAKIILAVKKDSFKTMYHKKIE